MRFRHLVACLLLLPVSELQAAAQEIKDVSWAQLREEVAGRRLNGRGVAIRLSDGKTVATTLRRIEADGLVVGLTPQVEKRWRPTGPEAKVPRADVESLRFTGRQGHGGLIGGLAGLGAGAAIIGGAVAATEPGEGHGMEGVVALPPLLGLAGYFIGRRHDRVIPIFRIVP